MSSETDCAMSTHDDVSDDQPDATTGESFSASRLADQAEMIDLDALD